MRPSYPRIEAATIIRFLAYATIASARLGPYEIVGLLGAGGMGEVYRASATPARSVADRRHDDESVRLAETGFGGAIRHTGGMIGPISDWRCR
jgi:hypothetical protein